MQGNNAELNSIGLAATCLAWFNQFFNIMNPALQFILYSVSITWIIIQIYYKILNENDTDPFDNKFYNEMSLSSTETFSQNPNSFIEEKYNVLTSAKTGGTEILNGTVAIANASVDVVGTSTRFFEEIKIGDTIAVGTSRIERVVASVSNNTFLTVSSAYSSTASTQEIYSVLNNIVGYNTPDGRNYNGFKYFAIKIVFLSSNVAFVPKVKNLRVLALA